MRIQISNNILVYNNGLPHSKTKINRKLAVIFNILNKFSSYSRLVFQLSIRIPNAGNEL